MPPLGPDGKVVYEKREICNSKYPACDERCFLPLFGGMSIEPLVQTDYMTAQAWLSIVDGFSS